MWSAEFCWLNSRTIKDAHPLPHQDDALAALGGNAIFSTLDLTSGYYNVEIHQEDKRFTAFTSVWFVWIQQTATGSVHQSGHVHEDDDVHLWEPNVFESLMLSGWHSCFCSQWTIGTVEAWDGVWEVKGAQPQVAPKKCHFIQSSVKFLGHIVSKDGISTEG